MTLLDINFSTSDALFRWRPAAWLRVTGEDAATFLQGQFTNDLRPLAAAGAPAIYGLWLSLKGKVVADSFVLRGENAGEFWLGSYFSAAAVIRERLESHIIADDVAIDDQTEHWEGVTCWGEGGAKRAAAAGARRLVFGGRRGRAPAWEVVFRRGDEPEWLARAGGATVAVPEMERLRIEAGIPAVPADIGPGDLPNEAGLEVDAISFHKGCYLGQEVMARLKAMGQVRRRLVRVRGAGGAPVALPAALFAGGRTIGELRSAVADGAGGWMGLALVSKLHATAETQPALAAEGPGRMSFLDTP